MLRILQLTFKVQQRTDPQPKGREHHVLMPCVISPSLKPSVAQPCLLLSQELGYSLQTSYWGGKRMRLKQDKA